MPTPYAAAHDTYAASGVDTDAAMTALAAIPISIHCWQGDDVVGYDNPTTAPGGGLAVTGNYPGRARTADELRADFAKALTLIPGRHRINLHALYAEHGSRHVDRDKIDFSQFSRWADWAKSLGIGVDFNPSLFAHPKAADGYTLSHADSGIRNFWVDHCIASRQIAAEFGRRLGSVCIDNIWIPDGSKDTPADRYGPRQRLAGSLDKVLASKLDPRLTLDAVEGKLFGIGSESYVVGSHEFYLGYCVKHGTLLTLDAGHYHPTESMADKISAVLCHLPQVLLHVSRGVRWDSDHVITLDDALSDIAREIVANGFLNRVHIGLDYFDASINRVAAWVIGVRNMQKALLKALLEPTALLKQTELAGDYTMRLAWQEEVKSLPWGAVWETFCQRQSVPVGRAWTDEIKTYEKEVLSRR